MDARTFFVVSAIRSGPRLSSGEADAIMRAVLARMEAEPVPSSVVYAPGYLPHTFREPSDLGVSA